jgi:hypothetical protein
LPALEQSLHEKPPHADAVLVIARFGPEAVPALTRALTNDERVVRFGARACLDMLRSHSVILFPKTAEDADFRVRACAFHLTVLGLAWEEYKAQHPARWFPDGYDVLPRARVPHEFNPIEASRTNAAEPEVSKPVSAFE